MTSYISLTSSTLPSLVSVLRRWPMTFSKHTVQAPPGPMQGYVPVLDHPFPQMSGITISLSSFRSLLKYDLLCSLSCLKLQTFLFTGEPYFILIFPFIPQSIYHFVTYSWQLIYSHTCSYSFHKATCRAGSLFCSYISA